MIDKDLQANRLVVGQGVDNPDLFHTHCRITDLHWITRTPAQSILDCSAKIRYRQQDMQCRISVLVDNAASVEFGEPQRAITPGQALVIYTQEQCLGGGTIEVAYSE